jgi:hypothetical protein
MLSWLWGLASSSSDYFWGKVALSPCFLTLCIVVDALGGAQSRSLYAFGVVCHYRRGHCTNCCQGSRVTAGRSFHSFLLSMNSSLLLTSAAATRVVHGAAISTGLIARQVAAADGPGYRASNVVETVTGLTADLTLAGPACNVLGRDIQELKLSVNYETGMYARSALMISC